MDRQAVIRHLRAWVDGFDPVTGAALPLDHPAQRTDTLRVLFAAIGHLGSTAFPGAGASTSGDATATTAPEGPRKAGRPWSADDDAALVAAFDAGATVTALAEGLERTRGAITARLVRLGKIEAPPGLRLRGSDGTRMEVASRPAPGQRA